MSGTCAPTSTSPSNCRTKFSHRLSTSEAGSCEPEPLESPSTIVVALRGSDAMVRPAVHLNTAVEAPDIIQRRSVCVYDFKAILSSKTNSIPHSLSDKLGNRSMHVSKGSKSTDAFAVRLQY